MQTLAKILKAVEKRRPVSIRYTKTDGTTSRRTIEIFDVRISDAGDVYFRAKDRGASRTFRLDRIESASILRGRVSFMVRSRMISMSALDHLIATA